MKKRKSWIYSVFVVLLILAIVLCLIFWPKNNSDINEVQDEIGEEENGEDNGEDEDETKTPLETYATSLTVNLPDTINMLVGTRVNLLSGYLEVQPSEMLNNVKTEITPRYQSSAFGLQLNNKTLLANEVGSYNLKFSVEKSATLNFTHTTMINIYQDVSNSHIIQINNSLTKGIDYELSDVFYMKENLNLDLVTDNKITYKNNRLKPILLGDSSISVKIIEDFIEYNYQFHFKIKDQPQYSIELKNVNNNDIEFDLSNTSVFFINYEIKNRNEEYVKQDVITNIENENILKIESCEPPLIKLNAKSVGETTLKITCAEDLSIFVIINIVIK